MPNVSILFDPARNHERLLTASCAIGGFACLAAPLMLDDAPADGLFETRTFAALLEALNRHRGKSSEQKVTVEQVHLHAGGQAIVGTVEAPGGRGRGKGKIEAATP